MDEYTKKLEEVWRLLDDREKANEKLHLDREAKINIERDSVKIILQEKLAENLEKHNPRGIEGAERALQENEGGRARERNGENQRYETEKEAIENDRAKLNNMHEQHLNERIALDKELSERMPTAERLVREGQPADPLTTAAKWIETAGPVAEKIITIATGSPGLPPEVSKDVYKVASIKAESLAESHNQKIDKLFLGECQTRCGAGAGGQGQRTNERTRNH